MIKTFIIYNEKDQYVIKNDENESLEIKKSTLNIDGTKLYDLMFYNFKKGDKISIKKDNSFDNESKIDVAVCENIKEIVKKIVDGINLSEEVK